MLGLSLAICEFESLQSIFPRSLVAISVLQAALHAHSRREVLGVFCKILLFAMCGLAFTVACMAYTSTAMVDPSELVGARPHLHCCRNPALLHCCC